MSLTKRNIIGVIGGMGPYAGIDLTRKIFDETVASRDQEHLPVALLSFPEQIDDRTDFMLDNKGTNPVNPISSIALQLERLGASVAGMSCNSAHAPPIFDAVQATLLRANSKLHLLNMVVEVVRHIKERGTTSARVGVLSTNSMFHLGVYRDAMVQADIAPVLPPQHIQESLVHTAIYDPHYGHQSTEY